MELVEIKKYCIECADCGMCPFVSEGIGGKSCSFLRVPPDSWNLELLESRYLKSTKTGE